MDWTAQVDIYCERIDARFWSEPINAVTNLAFILAALYVFPRVAGDRGARALAVILGLIGICSGLFHTFATNWASAADTLSILIYVVVYLYLATSRILGRDKAISLLVTIGFFPYAIVVERMFAAFDISLNGSVSYLPILILIIAYGFLAKNREAGTGLWVGAGILAVSIFFRSIDQTVCGALPIGTHFVWHCLNALALGWLALVMHRAGLGVAKPRAEG